MCDTQVIKCGNRTFFAKNSDREPGEPQLVCYIPAVENDSARQVNTTYIAVAQLARRYAVILSRPSWMWGAEMGLNDQGVVIGNEAVFTRLVDKTGQALLGMDLLRLALERSATAERALHCITGLLEAYGQGGSAGYRDKSFRYDNSFIIADSADAWVLETAGRHWVARKVTGFAAISNALTIGSEYELCSEGLVDFAIAKGCFNGRGDFHFARAFDTRFMKSMGCARQRREASNVALAELSSSGRVDFGSMAQGLRQHHHQSPDFSRHSNRDICMHAAGIRRPSQTCNSMIVELRDSEAAQIMLTGTSAPCLSLFQPLVFPDHGAGEQPILQYGIGAVSASLWLQFETVHRRALLDKAFRCELLQSRDQLEPSMFAGMGRPESYNALRADAGRWHRDWYDIACLTPPSYRWYNTYEQYWRRLSQQDGM